MVSLVFSQLHIGAGYMTSQIETQMQVDQPQSQDTAKDDQSTNQGEFLHELDI